MYFFVNSDMKYKFHFHIKFCSIEYFVSCLFGGVDGVVKRYKSERSFKRLLKLEHP